MAGKFGRTSLTDQVVAHLTRMITDGEWPAGTLLPTEAELAQELGVSRTVIRECVRVLASRGMLDVRQGRGTTATAPSAWNVAEPLAFVVKADRTDLLRWLEVRSILEVESAALAAQRYTGDDAAVLQQAVDRVAVTEPDAYREADIYLHLTIARATQNPALVRLLHPLVEPLREELQETAIITENRRAATQEHRAIVARILERDVPGARAAMAAHLARVADEIVQVMRGRGAELKELA
jgi:DNA-binding FadR family transcriptional regulator